MGISQPSTTQSTIPGQGATNAPTTLPGTLVFKIKPEFRPQGSNNGEAGPVLDELLRRLGATRVQQKFPNTIRPNYERPGAVDLTLVYQVWFNQEVALGKAQHALVNTGLLEYAEPLYYRAPLYLPNDPLADSTTAPGQYHLKKIRAYQAWDLTQGDTTVLIGITDTGFRLSHQDLTGQWQRNYQDPPDGIDNDHDGYVDNYRGWDFADRDNNPAPNSSSQPLHGVHTAGAASGRADNGAGIAGVGFKCRFLPLKIYPSTSTGTFAGYEAIVYAADHGCKIINMSWGGAGGRSQFEQDAITYAAINRDVVLVASAGNTNAELDFYPASYNHVLSVGWCGATDIRSNSATYSRRIDLIAPGEAVYTTWGDTDADYIRASGSSFSAPLVAGAAALVRARFPQLSSEQVIAQLRATTDNVYNLPGNAAYIGKLGTGRLNVFRAVQANNQHAVRLTQSLFSPSKSVYQLNDTIRLTIELQNLLQPMQNLTLTVTSLSPYVTVRQGSFTTTGLGTMSRVSNSATPFQLVVASAAPINTAVTLRYRLSDPVTGYQEDQFATIYINPEYVVLNAGNLAVTLSHRGSLGTDGLASDKGEGVRYKGGNSMLYEGGLLLGTGTTRISSRLRNDRNNTDVDFFTQAQTTLRRQNAYTLTATGILRDSLPNATRNRTVGVQVRQQATSWAQGVERDYVTLEYHIKNVTADTLKPLYAGIFADWDMGDYSRNAVVWDSVRHLSYAYNVNKPDAYVGVQWLRGGTVASYAIDVNAPVGSAVRLANGYSRAEKMLTLNNGTRQRTAGVAKGTDIAQVVSATMPSLAPSDSVVVTFAIVAAPTLAQLQTAADDAIIRYTQAQLLPVRSATAQVAWQLYPNPTAGHIRVEVPTSFGGKRLEVLSTLGQVVKQQTLVGSTATVDLQDLPAGIYVVRVQGPTGNLTRRVQLTR